MQPPVLSQFRYEPLDEGYGHLIFDQPGRTMNVFSDAAIGEAERVADWLAVSGLKGLVISSGKTTAFCAGADLGELAQAYAAIIAEPPEQRWQAGRDAFAPIGRAFRKLETAGVPVAVAVNGLALGGGCEFALAAHYRVLTESDQTQMGLPESLVGLLPGAGGTQRMPRLVGLDRAIAVLLDGARFTPAQALAAGLADQLVPAGEEIAACLAWLKTAPDPIQPWDRADWAPPSPADISARLAPLRAARQAQTGGHFPAITAILDCLEQGFPQAMDAAVQTEIAIFADLIKRPEPRDMIAAQFIGKQLYQKLERTAALPPVFDDIASAILQAWAAIAAEAGQPAVEAARHFARFGDITLPTPVATTTSLTAAATVPPRAPIAKTEMWLDAPAGEAPRLAARLLAQASIEALRLGGDLSEAQQKAADYRLTRDLGFPVYLGGPFSLYASLGSDGLNRLAA